MEKKKIISNTSIGNLGEQYAVDYLQNDSYEILERNWRYKRAEIDIICKKESCLIFVEVKTKSYTAFGAPEESVNEKKEALIMDAAQRYMEQINHNWEIRFDIISIIIDNSQKLTDLQHFKDAFF